MIRMVLFGLAFLGITIGLLVVQPGSNRRAPEPYVEPVTRAEPAIVAPVVEARDEPRPEVAPLEIAAPRPVTVPVPVPVTVPEPNPPVVPRPVVLASPESMDDDAMRKLTWSTLSSLNHATGRESAPGQPGSLLHTIVRRSLDDNPAQRTHAALAASDAAAEATGLYVVQEGDTLVSIAERVYGDMNMTGPLFAANQAILARPDDLRPGQTLVLPEM